MSEITLIRIGLRLTDAERQQLNRTLFGVVDGLADEDKRVWRRFWRRIADLEAGEIFSISTWSPRHGGYHRRHMLIESRVFQAQERIVVFASFRQWLKVGAGFVDWLPGPRGGGVIPVPKSISYKKCDDDVMRQFHEEAIAFLRTRNAQKVLWPHLSAEHSEAMIEGLLAGFGE